MEENESVEMKLLFLDIDGVLNSYRSDLVFGRDKTVENLDPVSLDLLRKVVKKTDCVICLSSNWRFLYDYMKLGKQLKLPILFQTPNFKEGLRSDEIKDVVDSMKPECYVVLDDEEDRHEFDGMPFVNVAEEEGLSYKDYLLLLEYLK